MASLRVAVKVQTHPGEPGCYLRARHDGPGPRRFQLSRMLRAMPDEKTPRQHTAQYTGGGSAELCQSTVTTHDMTV
jgi:hypothetical protein